jgi:hypothetical protein
VPSRTATAPPPAARRRQHEARPTSRCRAAVVALLAAGALAACSGDDDAADVSLADVDSPTDTGATSADLAPTPEVEPPTPARGFGEPCTENRACESGWCVPSETGLVCTRGCIPSCPDGWICGRVVDAGVDDARVCHQWATTLCQPCVADADCAGVSPELGGRCLSYGDAGSFCGLACDLETPCPGGYLCTDASGAAAREGHCRATAGCSCNETGRSLGLFTTCTARGALGACVGTRGCGDDGLEACSAAPPAEERCNGLDDDCDGTIDGALPVGDACAYTTELGTCPGVMVCSGGSYRCVGTPPEAERCDGVDQDCDGAIDEGFPDLDGDASADCVDPDEDGDGTPNVEDCATRDAARGAQASESCNGVDDDCDGAIDEPGAAGCAAFHPDFDGDGRGSATDAARCLCAADPDGVWDATTATDCDDRDPGVFPGAPEACNGRDDDCDRGVDEGVTAPCGGCANVCLLAYGVDADRLFTLGPHATNLAFGPAGALQLGPGQLAGSYRVTLAGWPLGGTRWEGLFLTATTPSGTSLRARWRTASTASALPLALWSAYTAPMPPATSPLWVDAEGGHVEVEVAFATTSTAVTPALTRLEMLSSLR